MNGSTLCLVCATLALLAIAPVGAAQTIEVRVASGTDDAEEAPGGSTSLTSSDLEMTFQDGGSQIVGMRFQNIQIPPGASISAAYLQFQADERTTVSTALTIAGQSIGDAPTFSTSPGSVSSRTLTSSFVFWSPPPWVRGDAGLAQRTPDLSAVVQEIVNLAGWNAGNDMVLVITGTGERVAESFNGLPAAAPLLHIEFTSSGNLPPSVSAGPDQTVDIDTTNVTLNGTVTDDGQTGFLSTLWTHVGGTGSGTVSFANAVDIDTTATLPQNTGTYILRLTADDGEFIVFDDVTMEVQPPSGGVLIDADFAGGTQGFTYEDDAFRGTDEPAYASGSFTAGGGFTNGGLRVTLGGIDNADIFGMSGGWLRSFTLAEPSDISVSLRYKLTQSPHYENDELSEVLVSLDGQLVGQGANDYVARITGNGNGGGNQSTGFQQFSFTRTGLSAGTHTLRLGGYNNKKTFANENSVIVIDDVLVSGAAPAGGGNQIVGITQVNFFATGFNSSGDPLTVPSTDPASIVYHEPSGRLFVADSEINEIPAVFSQIQANIFEVSPSGNTLFASYDVTNSPSGFFNNKEPTGLTYLVLDDHFYSTNDDNRTLFRYGFGNGGFTVVDAISTLPHTDDPEGVTCDPATGMIYVIGGDFRIVTYLYNAGFQQVSTLDLLQTAGTSNGIPSDPEGIVFDPVSRHLFVVSDPDDALFEYTLDGAYVSTLDLSGFDPRPIAIQGATIGPSSNSPNEMSFYISDGGIDNNQNPDERDGRIYEARIIRGE